MTDKQKNIALVVGFLVLLIISYVFSIQKTLDLKSRLSLLEKEQELLSNANERIFSLQQQNKYLDSILINKNLSIENSFQQTILNTLSEFAKTVPIDIISFEEPHSFVQDNTYLHTYSFEVKGEFSSLLKLVNTFERQRLGTIKSLDFEKKKNYRLNRQELTVRLYMQKLSKFEQGSVKK